MKVIDASRLSSPLMSVMFVDCDDELPITLKSGNAGSEGEGADIISPWTVRLSWNCSPRPTVV